MTCHLRRQAGSVGARHYQGRADGWAAETTRGRKRYSGRWRTNALLPPVSGRGPPEGSPRRGPGYQQEYTCQALQPRHRSAGCLILHDSRDSTSNFCEVEPQRERMTILGQRIKAFARVEEGSSAERNRHKNGRCVMWAARGSKQCQLDTARGRLEKILASIARCQLTRVASTSGEIHCDVCMGDDIEFRLFEFEGLGIPPVETDVKKKN